MDEVDLDAPMSLLRRLPVLAACRDGQTTRRELAERAGLSRTTAYRATTELTDRGLLEASSAGYRTTARGVAALEAANRYCGAIETVEELTPLFEHVDHPELLANAHRLGPTDVVVADATNPYRVIERSIDRLAETTTSVGTLASATSAEAVRQSEPLVPDLAHFERILTEQSLRAHASMSDGRFEAVLEAETIEILVAPTDAVPFSFAIDDADVSIVGHDPSTGLPTVHVESAEPAARSWLEDLYERCRERATPLAEFGDDRGDAVDRSGG